MDFDDSFAGSISAALVFLFFMSPIILLLLSSVFNLIFFFSKKDRFENRALIIGIINVFVWGCLVMMIGGEDAKSLLITLIGLFISILMLVLWRIKHTRNLSVTIDPETEKQL